MALPKVRYFVSVFVAEISRKYGSEVVNNEQGGILENCFGLVGRGRAQKQHVYIAHAQKVAL